LFFVTPLKNINLSLVLGGTPMTIKAVNNRGHKAKIGSVMFDDDGLAFFAGYHRCPNCGAQGKILIDMDDVRELGRKFGHQRDKLGARLARRLVRHYE
jgi:hypothetical protein